jgi:hypothetical protein
VKVKQTWLHDPESIFQAMKDRSMQKRATSEKSKGVLLAFLVPLRLHGENSGFRFMRQELRKSCIAENEKAARQLGSLLFKGE